MSKKQPLGIYVHIPFCLRKCNYCDFLSAPATKQVQNYYISNLVEQIKQYKPLIREYDVKTIFFGGGTPSMVEISEMGRVMDELGEFISGERANLNCQNNSKIQGNFNNSENLIVQEFLKNQEITIESNPKTLTKEKLMFYKKSGFNRLSIGLQSTNENELKLLGRIHTYEDFLQNYNEARECGFENINIDLMSALPEQSLKDYQMSLEKIVSLKPEHISAYSLIIEEETKFYDWYSEKEDLLPDEETEREMYYITKQYLKENGYERYEISNYAKNGYESRHNLSYWSGIDYLGLGLGASSLIKGSRFQMESDLNTFCEEVSRGKSVEREKTELSKNEQMEEFMFLGLRKIKGVSEQEFLLRFGQTIEEVYGTVLKKLQDEKVIQRENGMIALTEYGIDVSNVVLSEFLL